MIDDPDEYVAMAFHGLVFDLQREDVARFEAEQKQQAAARATLRAAVPHGGMNAGELLKSIDGDPEEVARREGVKIDKIERQAKDAADAVAKERAPVFPDGHFPPPPVVG